MITHYCEERGNNFVQYRSTISMGRLLLALTCSILSAIDRTNIDAYFGQFFTRISMPFSASIMQHNLSPSVKPTFLELMAETGDDFVRFHCLRGDF